MTTEARLLGAIIETLWATPGEEVHAVLDAARDPAVRATLVASGERSACLYEGRVAKPIADVAPYIVTLPRSSRFAEQLLEKAWGKSWGIFVSSQADFESLRRHFRRFLRVVDENGRRLLFRYYDPRVLRAYLPTCTEGELDMVFGPLSSYFAEDDDVRRLNVYARRNGTYSMRPVPLP